MNDPRSVPSARRSLPFVALVLLRAAAAVEWLDPFYETRTPVTMTAPEPGGCVLAIDPAEVTSWINGTARYPFRTECFAFDNVKLVAIGDDGTQRPVRGAFRVQVGRELVVNGSFTDGQAGWRASTEQGFRLADDGDGLRYLAVEGADRHAWLQKIQTKPHTWYRLSWRSKGRGGPHAMIGRKREPKLWLQPINHSFADPAVPMRQWRSGRYFFYTGDQSDWTPEGLSVRVERFTGAVDDISLRECRVAFVAHLTEPGPRKCFLYYAPREGVTPTPPREEAGELPDRTLAVERAGEVEWLDAEIAYTVGSTESADVWYATPTRKVGADDSPPAARRDKVTWACARNESEAIQLVVRPKRDGRIESVAVDLVGPRGKRLPPAAFDIRRAHYVSIRQPSTYVHGRPSRHQFTGQLPDPLPKFASSGFHAQDPNILIWIDVAVPKDAAAGTYRGAAAIRTDRGTIPVPLELEVWDFALPDRPACRTGFAVNRYAHQSLFPFHKVTTREDKYALSRAYIAEMARYRVSAKWASAADIWHRNALGHTKDPVRLITQYYHEIDWALRQLHLTGFIIGHRSGPLMGKCTLDEGRKDAKFYEPVAAYLDYRGWLDDAYIWIDEPQPKAFDGVKNWVQGFREQAHARKIKMFPLVYNGQAYEDLLPAVDIMALWDGESGSIVSPRAVAEAPEDKEVWFYYTRNAAIWIDTPGMNNRLWAPKVWAFGGKGIAIWGTLQWWTAAKSPHVQHNPWENPLTTWGNGALCFFYPPSPKGKDIDKRDLTIVPSLRMVLYRDGIEDFDYAVLLQRLVTDAEAAGIDATAGRAALAMLRRPFASPQSWTLSETYWRAARAAAARAIVQLLKRRSPK